MLRTVNRVVLGLAGLLLVALGAAVLTGGLDLVRRWHLPVPPEWPFDGPGDVLLPTATRQHWRAHGWWWPAVVGGLAVLVLAALAWLAAQLRPRRLRETVVDCGDGDTATVRGRGLEDAMAAEAAALHGVDRALVTLGGRRTAPAVRAVLTLAPHAGPAAVLYRLRTEVLRHARTSAGLGRLPAEVRLRAVRHRAERVG
ncbi:hypothetical protein GCM10010218_62070 [Streptomyces mashuensis]|uniref:Alkaline shock response membrane anchor protein AmaP n=1 Tax=Streptomyces mashuensis TaxID=33904 RepID=A0A919B8U7_9ACTN|nr:alkaline shock response membrane anchor protein AmaP [Streptomyces mashuensis]GHF72358.1 hypothetical protein GCM10010218_62070 [Streptomyces mashuensis]